MAEGFIAFNTFFSSQPNLFLFQYVGKSKSIIMKKLIQTIFLLGLVPAVAVGQTLSSQGFVTVDNELVVNTEVRMLANSANPSGIDTLDVVMSDASGYYYIIGDLLEGQSAPFIETDACPDMHYPVVLSGNDTINISCGDSSFTDVGLYVGAYPLDADNMSWYFMNNLGNNDLSYSWTIDGSSYSTAGVTHTFDEPGTYIAELTVILDSGESLSATKTIIAGSGANNCEALFFALPDSTPDGSVYFVNASLGSNLSYFWDFDDGSTSNEQYPTHLYGDAAVMYNVCLTITGDDCNETYCIEINGQGDGSGLITSGIKPSTNLSKADGFTFVVVPMAGAPTGQNDIENQIPLGVFPNPSTGTVTLELNLKNGGNGIVKMTDISGKTVLETNVATVSNLNIVSINLNDLADGVYLIQYLGDQNSKVQKVVLQR